MVSWPLFFPIAPLDGADAGLMVPVIFISWPTWSFNLAVSPVKS